MPRSMDQRGLERGTGCGRLTQARGARQAAPYRLLASVHAARSVALGAVFVPHAVLRVQERSATTRRYGHRLARAGCTAGMERSDVGATHAPDTDAVVVH